MRQVFTASRVTDGNALFPDKIIITDEFFIFRKARVIGYEEKKIRFSSIGSVSLNRHLLFSDIIVETNGGQVIVANGFSHSDAKRIAELLS
ncbi:MAG: PH domain-containing protein [Muribaculaceae bacterium]|nr:PH domain-containing protein [Muribaculaceae bacterium]